MKTINKKTFDAVQYMREQRDLLNEKLSKMSDQEIIKYFKEKAKKSKIKPGKNN